jgi:hypothetical protein
LIAFARLAVRPGKQGFATLNRSKEIFTGRLADLERGRGKSPAYTGDALTISLWLMITAEKCATRGQPSLFCIHKKPSVAQGI